MLLKKIDCIFAINAKMKTRESNFGPYSSRTSLYNFKCPYLGSHSCQSRQGTHLFPAGSNSEPKIHNGSCLIQTFMGLQMWIAAPRTMAKDLILFLELFFGSAEIFCVSHCWMVTARQPRFQVEAQIISTLRMNQDRGTGKPYLYGLCPRAYWRTNNTLESKMNVVSDFFPSNNPGLKNHQEKCSNYLF